MIFFHRRGPNKFITKYRFWILFRQSSKKFENKPFKGIVTIRGKKNGPNQDEYLLIISSRFLIYNYFLTNLLS